MENKVFFGDETDDECAAMMLLIVIIGCSISSVFTSLALVFDLDDFLELLRPPSL